MDTGAMPPKIQSVHREGSAASAATIGGMEPNPYQPPEQENNLPRAANQRQPSGCLTIAAFMGGSFAAWLVTGAILMNAIDGVELHPDSAFLGAACLFCPLVGLLTALVTWRLTTRRQRQLKIFTP
jgi:hypothetical protein